MSVHRAPLASAAPFCVASASTPVPFLGIHQDGNYVSAMALYAEAGCSAAMDEITVKVRPEVRVASWPADVWAPWGGYVADFCVDCDHWDVEGHYGCRREYVRTEGTVTGISHTSDGEKAYNDEDLSGGIDIRCLGLVVLNIV